MLHVSGFQPREVSALLNLSVIEEHADDAATLWRMHEHGVRAPLYRLRDLVLLDGRVLAHLDGLRTAGSAGLTFARRGLATEDPGAAFVFAYLAFSVADTDAMGQIVKVAAREPKLTDALVAAMAWLELEDVQQPLRLLRRSEIPDYRRVALAVTAAHRAQSEDIYKAGATDANPRLRARALRAIGETKNLKLEPILRSEMRAAEMSCRFWAAWSMALFGDERAAAVAFESGIDDPALSGFAIEIAMRGGKRSWAQDLIRSLARDPSTLRQAIVAAGALGDPAVVPWLLPILDQPSLARVAAEAIASITGVDLEEAAFKQDAPDDVPEEHEDDSDLRWPSPGGLSDWWQRERHRFTPGQRFIAGVPLSESAALHVLRHGYQRQRRGAAIELARMREDAVLFPTAARGDRQQRRLGR